MIFRPVSPQSPIGPPITNRPVGLTRTRGAACARRTAPREHGLDHVLPQVVLDQRLGAVAVLGRDQQLLDLDRAAVDVAHGHLRLPVRAQVRQDLGACARPRAAWRACARARSAAASAPRSRSTRTRTSSPGRRRRRRRARRRRRVGARLPRAVDALGDVGRLLVDRVDHRARVVVEAVLGVRVADLA